MSDGEYWWQYTKGEWVRKHSVETRFDQSGLGKVWLVFVDGVLIWSHAAIEGPVPDAVDLWEHLDKALKQ